MIISRAPYLISLFWGSTDYPSYYSKYEALDAFTSEDIQQIGNLLNESWLAKKNIAKNITSDNVVLLVL